MHVALVIERIESWRGGAERSTRQFIEHLAGLGVGVTVVTASNTPSTPSMTVAPIGVGRILRWSRSSLFARRAAGYVRRHSFDLVHAITPCPAADVYQPRGGTIPETLERNRAMRPDRARRGLKRAMQELNVKTRILGDLERQLLTRQPPPMVIAISQYVADQLQRHYAFDPARVRLIFNGVDPDTTPAAERREQRADIRRQYGLADDDYLLLAMAHNFRLKGVGPLIEALARCRSAPERRTVAIIVGRGNPSGFAGLVAQRGVQDRVIFAGSSQRPDAFLHAADVLVHPTYYDPCSRVVLEALAAGLPVVTTRYNGAAERVVDGRQGYVIDSPDDVNALADRIERLADPGHRKSCAEQASEAVASITMRHHAERVLELYEDILRDRSAGSPRRERGG